MASCPASATGRTICNHFITASRIRKNLPSTLAGFRSFSDLNLDSMEVFAEVKRPGGRMAGGWPEGRRAGGPEGRAVAGGRQTPHSGRCVAEAYRSRTDQRFFEPFSSFEDCAHHRMKYAS